MSDRLSQILDFLIILDEFKTVNRMTYIADGSRRENDAEHTWHMAMVAILMHQEIGFEADLGHTLCLILTHDLVEIYAGDTYAYDAVAAAEQQDREQAAAERLFGMLPDDLGTRLNAWWTEFEAAETAEARLAKACDRLQGFLQNYIAGGRSWRENGITRARTAMRNDFAVATDPALAALVHLIYDRADREELWPAPYSPVVSEAKN